LLTDVVDKGVILCGGGAMIQNLDKLISEEIKMPVWVADDPQTCVVRGCAKLLENEKLLDKFRIIGGLR